MSWLLHRDTCAAVIRGGPRVSARFAQHLGQLHVSAVTVVVLEMWLARARTPARYLHSYGAIFQQLTVVPCDDAVARRAASIGSTRGAQRPRMTLVDLLVAATAVTHGFTLVTGDLAHFANIQRLTVDDWFVP
jgi:predicted nucleic acid-binding protein